MNIEKIYPSLPTLMQSLACSFEGWRIRWNRYNADFVARLVQAERRAKLSYAELAAFRDAQIRNFVHHAATTVPYYRRLFRQLGAESGDFRTLADLGRLPVLRKSEVQQEPAAFLSEAVPERERVRMHTSGTTGAGLHFWTSHPALREQYAIWWRHLHRHGLRQGQWCAYFAGRSVVPVGQRKPPFWRVNVPGRQVLLSAYHLNDANAVFYMQELGRRKLPWLHGYPSFITQIATYILDSGFDLGYRPRWITTSSENLHAHQARVIEAAFGVKPVQNYGLAEMSANISQAPDGRLHVDEDFSAVEFVAIGQDGLHKVIGTNFSNPATPLLRYDTGDLVRIAGSGDSDAHGGRVVDSIDGRQEDYVVLPNGVRIGRMDHIFKDLVNVREAQIRQHRPGAITVLVVKAAQFGEADEAAMVREFRARLGDDMLIDIRYVDRIEKTRTGKLRFVVSEMDAGNARS